MPSVIESGNPPQVIVAADAEQASLRVAQMFAQLIQDKPRCVLGLATGSTPIRCYQELIRLHRECELCFEQLTTFNLDEYVGLDERDPQSFRAFMQAQLFDHVNVDRTQTHVPNGTADDLARHAEEYEQAIAAAGGIDLQLLGIGRNGHIAFNEPGATVDCRTRVVALTDSTINTNARFFDDPSQVPRQALTMGIGTILAARSIVLLATGADKATAVAAALEGDISSANPASLLRTHKHVIFVLDQDAASELTTIENLV